MRKSGITALLAGVLAASLAHADDRDALEELGVALGWRLTPATIEEFCRKIDPVVETLILEVNFTGNDAEKTLAACKVEADPTRAAWTSNGRPFVDEAQAALYDWKAQQTAK